MRKALLLLLAAVAALPFPARTGEGPACADRLPAALSAPAGSALAFELGAEGVQVYECTAGTGGPAWSFQAPEAALLDEKGQRAGRHYAGPTWEAADGSRVVGVKVEGATPDPASIPWLLLRASAHAGPGRMADVTFVQRVATRGGTAPAAGCDAAHAGTVARVPYRAAYCFYRPAAAK